MFSLPKKLLLIPTAALLFVACEDSQEFAKKAAPLSKSTLGEDVVLTDDPVIGSDGSGDGAATGAGSGDGVASGDGSATGAGSGDGVSSGDGSGSGSGDGVATGGGSGSGDGVSSGDGSGSGDGVATGGGSTDGDDGLASDGGGSADGSGNSDGSGSGSGDGDDGLASDGGGSADGSGDGGSSTGKTTVCHVTNNANNSHIELEISDNALQAHLGHGDTIGSCDLIGGNDGGNGDGGNNNEPKLQICMEENGQSIDLEVLESELKEYIDKGALLGKCPEIILHQYEEEFSQNSIDDQKVDIAFVIDNSGSMHNNQVNLAQNLPNFLNGLLQKGNIDFQVMATSTDPRSRKPYGDGKLLKGNGKRVITSADFANDPGRAMGDFQDMVMPGTSGSGHECSLNGAKRVLERNSQYFREDADLVLIMISDENDTSLSYFDKNINYFTDAIRGFKSPERNTKILSVVNTTTYGTYETRGEIQIAASDSHFDILADWGQNLEVIGDLIANLLADFALEKVPHNPNEIIIHVDGVQVTSGWSYDAANNAIHFETEPAEGATIKVQYSYEESQAEQIAKN